MGMVDVADQRRRWSSGNPGGGRRAILTALSQMPYRRDRHNNRVVILCYHSVHPFKSFGSTHPRLFALHLEWLRERCDVIPLRDALAVVQGPPRPRPAVAITFDDGYADLHEHALPVLAGHSIAPTLFVITGLANGDPRVLRRMAALQGGSPVDAMGLSWTQIAELRDAGWEVGSHTDTHINLGGAQPSRALSELQSSRAMLEDHLGGSVTQLAYPFGKPKHHFTHATMKLAFQSGYRTATAIHYRGIRPTDSGLALPRFAVGNDSVQMLASKVLGKLDILGLWQERAPRWLSRAASPSTTNFADSA
jgi:peptidoglycan/xylan/chitin deacetylase (PgdA/CDA1 family)